MSKGSSPDQRQIIAVARLIKDHGANEAELAILNQTDRFSLAIDVIDRVPKLQSLGAHAKERFRNQLLESRAYAYENGIDKPEIVHWKWTDSADGCVRE